MARKSSGTILQEELYPSPSAVFRAQKPRARNLTTRAWSTWMWTRNLPFCAGKSASPPAAAHFPRKLPTASCGPVSQPRCSAPPHSPPLGVYEYGERSWRFRVESSDNIEVTGMENVTKAQIMEVMGADIGRNIFFIPLAQQKAQLEQIPWVESASVMRFVPNRLRLKSTSARQSLLPASAREFL